MRRVLWYMDVVYVTQRLHPCLLANQDPTMDSVWSPGHHRHALVFDPLISDACIDVNPLP
jgi:hypothetical protein